MANLVDFIKLENATAAFASTFDRANAIPIDKTSVIETYSQAKTYASSSPIAYIGQILFVCWKDDAKTESLLKHYKVVAVSTECPDGLEEFGGAGSLSNYVKKSEITTTLADYIDGDDGLLAKEDDDTITRKLYLSDFTNGGEIEDNAVYGINKYTDGKSASLSKLTLKSFLPAESTDEGKVITVDNNGDYTLSEVEIKWKEYNE